MSAAGTCCGPAGTGITERIGVRSLVGILLGTTLAAAVTRLWLTTLGSSFWVDEMVTAFVVRHGQQDASLAVAPQVPQSLYYPLARLADDLFGLSEVAYRLPSVLAASLALWLVAKLTMRLIHPQAGWLAVFACLSLKGFNYTAADARPYALGLAVGAAALWFLVCWLDAGRRRDAGVFLLLAALLWRVHLIYWPFYLVFGLYAAVRLLRGASAVNWTQVAAVFALLSLALLPVAWHAVALHQQAGAHVIVPPPRWSQLAEALKLRYVLACGLLAALGSRWLGRPARQRSLGTATALVLGWWLAQPLALFAYSRLTGNSVFVPRYLSLGLPGVALAVVLAVAPFVRSRHWRPLSLAFGLATLLFMGQWKQGWPAHHNSDWRAAAEAVNALGLPADTPLLCPSPFVEARSPVWRPDYALPGFLYAHLETYALRGRPFLLPFAIDASAEAYLQQLAAATLAPGGRFLLFGGDRATWNWTDRLERQPVLAGWRHRKLGPFGDVDVVLFEPPDTVPRLTPVLLRSAQAAF